jgi:eukaryotic-like serine/threonine-protein kinase
VLETARPDRGIEPAGKDGWGFGVGEEIVPGRTAQSRLGGGQRYEAWVAWNERLMMPTVLKVLRPGLVEDERARRSLAAESDLLASLDHPGLTRLFGRDLSGDRPYLELEYLDGPRLSTLIRRHGRLNPDQAFPLGRHVAATLHYLHSEGVLHLDVKPSNIIMGPVPRLIDLSVARRHDTVARISGFVGTDAYMAPEQAEPSAWRSIGPNTDIWGLGATLYEAVAKQLPYPKGRRNARGRERFPQLVHDPLPLDARRHSPGLAALLADCLQRVPTARPGAAEVFDRLDELAANAGVGRVRFR